MPEARRSVDSTREMLAFLTCTVIWGSTFLVIRVGNDTVPPLWAATLRLIVAAVVLLALVRIGGQRLPTGAALRSACWYGFFLFGINMPLLYWGETVVSSGLAAVVYATIPVTSVVIARLFGLERLVPVKIAAALVALAGVSMLFLRDLTAGVTALPLLAVFLATVASAIGNTLLKLGPRQDAIPANAVATLLAAPICLLGSFLMRETRTWPATGAQIVPILYLAIAGSVVAFVAVSWLVQRWDVSSIAFIGVAVPVIAVTLGVVFRGEPFHREHAIGSALVFAGVILAIVSDRRRARQARSSTTE